MISIFLKYAVHPVIVITSSWRNEGSPSDIMTKVQDCSLKVSSNPNCTITFKFRLIPLGKV